MFDLGKVYRHQNARDLDIYVINKVKESDNQVQLTIVFISKLNNQIVKFIESKKYNNIELRLEEIKSKDQNIDILVSLDQGRNLFLDKINIKGNTITQEKTIRDNFIISEGDNLNSSKIKKSIDQIKSKQYFSKVDYKIEDSDKKNLLLTKWH